MASAGTFSWLEKREFIVGFYTCKNNLEKLQLNMTQRQTMTMSKLSIQSRETKMHKKYSAS